MPKSKSRKKKSLALPDLEPRALRDHAMVAMLIGCGLHRAELQASSSPTSANCPSSRTPYRRINKGSSGALLPPRAPSAASSPNFPHCVRQLHERFCATVPYSRQTDYGLTRGAKPRPDP
jgi:hypothetical protein